MDAGWGIDDGTQPGRMLRARSGMGAMRGCERTLPCGVAAVRTVVSRSGAHCPPGGGTLDVPDERGVRLISPSRRSTCRLGPAVLEVPERRILGIGCRMRWAARCSGMTTTPRSCPRPHRV
jgi:hypothetical protein